MVENFPVEFFSVNLLLLLLLQYIATFFHILLLLLLLLVVIVLVLVVMMMMMVVVVVDLHYSHHLVQGNAKRRVRGDQCPLGWQPLS